VRSLALSDTDLYLRGAETLLASWEYARGAVDAAVRRRPGVAVAVFAHGPERAVYNNALFDTGLAPVERERADAVEVMEAVYAAAG
jgi:hypothetical protein